MVVSLPDILQDEIKRQGPMPLSRYMELCLAHPEQGYYMTRDPFGAAGDFTTAPEISQMFGELIGAWAADAWMQMGAPSSFVLLECGPGRGTLMSDLMRATKHVPGFHEAAEIHFLECSPVLKDRQRETLSGYEVTWHTAMASVPTGMPVILIGNEFLDALPVDQLIKNGRNWDVRCVDYADDAFRFVTQNASEVLTDLILPGLIDFDDGDVVEVSKDLNQFLKSAFFLIQNKGGTALFLDYGYAHTAAGDSVQALYKHQSVSIFEHIGHADLTAHVNFENVARLAMEGGLTVHGPATQGQFLRRLGIEARAQTLLSRASDVQGKEIRGAVQRLCAPEQMGDLFKVIAVCHDPAVTLAGFA